VVITPRYLVLFRNIILDKGSQSPSMIAKLESMTLPNETMDDSLVLMKASEDEDFNLLSGSFSLFSFSFEDPHFFLSLYSLLPCFLSFPPFSEKEVLTQIEDRNESPDVDPRKKTLRDVKSQIRAILSILPISRALRHGSLMDVLRAESMVVVVVLVVVMVDFFVADGSLVSWFPKGHFCV